MLPFYAVIDTQAIERVIHELRELSNLPSMGLIGMREFLRKQADALEAALKHDAESKTNIRDKNKSGS
jgi:hypothetical protein